MGQLPKFNTENEDPRPQKWNNPEKKPLKSVENFQFFIAF